MRGINGALCLILLCQNAWAQDRFANADISYGEYLAGECVTCHRQTDDTQGIPSILGLDREAFYFIINAYKTGEIEHPVMHMIAKRLDDEQIASLAIYYESIKPD